MSPTHSSAMRIRSWNLLLLLLPFGSIGLSAQRYDLDRCSTPREPLGVLTGGGEVRYELKHDGRPDTGSVSVLAVNGISAAGYRSAVVRQLSSCKMRHPHQSPVMVRQAIRFDATHVTVDPAVPADTSVPGLPILAVALPSGTIEGTDHLLEEIPRYVRCDRHPAPPPGRQTMTFRSREEMEAFLARDARDLSGTVRARLVVDPAGRVIRDSITVLSTNNPNVTNNAITYFASCHYTPGRIAGAPVQTAVRAGFGIVVSSEPPPR